MHVHTQNKQKKILNGGTAMAVPAVAVPPAMQSGGLQSGDNCHILGSWKTPTPVWEEDISWAAVSVWDIMREVTSFLGARAAN